MAGHKITDQYRTIIWDWNGTLLNDLSLCVDIANSILTNHDIGMLDEHRYKEVFGFPITSYYERLGVDLEKESFEELTRQFISRYMSGVKNCPLHENVVETLHGFQSAQTNQFILTAAHKDSVLELLGHYEIKNYFKAIEGLDNHRAESKVVRGNHLIENNRIAKNEAVMIGDTIHDFEVANAIGVDCILIANGHQSKRRLVEKTGAEVRVLNHIGELQDL